MTRVASVAALAALAWSIAPPRAATFDEAAKPGANYDKAEFRLWLPEGAGPVRALVVLVPGSNGDGRTMVDDPFWQAFAVRHNLGLVGCHLTDKPHDQSFIEEYADVARGSGRAFLDSLAALGARAGHPEIATAPLMLWGMSAGGEFDYEFAVWQPDRVIAFVVNKGNIYYTALAPAATRRIPALLFTGEKDLDFRVSTVNGIFAVNRRAGALWALTEEPGIGHEVGRSKDLGAMLFEDVLDARLPDAVGGALKPLSEKDGFIADLAAKTYAPMGDSRPPNHTTAWLPTERLAKAWQAVVTGKPFGESP
jgi:pimeloyl-ACP methyl ester carboxylesterase